MLNARSLAVGVVLAALAAASARVAASGSADVEQVDAFYGQFANAFRAKDVDAMMSLYVRSGALFVFDMSPPRELVGWNANRAAWQKAFAGFKGPLKFTLLELGVTVSGDVAYTHSLQRIAGTAQSGDAVHLTIRVTDVLRKIDGRWLIVLEHVSLPVDPDSGEADWDSK